MYETERNELREVLFVIHFFLFKGNGESRNEREKTRCLCKGHLVSTEVHMGSIHYIAK